jgi:NADP-dependent 3-hydroxy acid dehydrogenase YdfG
VPVDISDFDAATAAVEEIAGRLGGIDALVNNAGVMLHSPVGAGYADDWQRIFDINVIGTLHITRAALPHLRAAPRADLLMVASTSADRVNAPDYGVYAATKAAQARLVDGLRLELADAPQVRVVLVKPGFMNTPGLGPGTRNPELQKNVTALKEKIGLPPVRVAEQLVHVLAVPQEVTITEITIMPTAKA